MKTDSYPAKQLNLQIARFFYACNIPFNVAENKEFKSMIALLRPGYSPPNRKELSGRLLDTIHDQISEYILEQTRGKDVTLIQDGWSDIHNNPVIATSIHTGSKTYFLNAVDTGPNKKTASYCASLFQEAISEAETKFRCRTVGIITDNERIMEAMRNKLYEMDNSLITYGCSSHLLNLLGQDVTPQKIINTVIDVSKYFRNHHTPGALLSEFSNQGAVKPQIPGSTRWNSQLECIKIFNKNRPFYLMINAQHEEILEPRIISIINNTGLTSQAKYLQEQLEPIYIALNTLQSEHSTIADACHVWLKLLNNQLLNPYQEKVRHRFAQAMTPFHFLAFFVHPKYRGRGLYKEHLESANQILSSKWQGVLSDLCAFQAETNPFPQHMFEETFLEKVEARVWWLCIKKTYKKVNAELCDLALHLLQLPSSSASKERIFSNFSFIQTKLRNRLGLEKASKLVTCYRELGGSFDFDW